MKIISNYTAAEFNRIQEVSKEKGMSMNQLQAYALMLFCDMPRTENMDVAEMRRTIVDYINNYKGETFICSAPFGNNWIEFSKRDKDTAAKIVKGYALAGYLEIAKKVSNLNHYRKLKDIPEINEI